MNIKGGPNQPWNPVSHAQVQQLQQQLEGSTSAEQVTLDFLDGPKKKQNASKTLF